ncbi:hypothetical protein ETAA8_59580 [Anatilimnocola aggregata]|uniref:Uncharacterized protein n=1 Tax=Anatilimnocola aggregata TaxID=2528021 RepID=A0A517YKR6_9BACT|nr:hypothetical protein [Anatilimnocola aggregata]QDU30809.1 hypothetical protein ETAA8_59580 [Anatilimnocola aggregata]
MTNRAPLIVAIVLLLLPLLYVVSYVAIVQPYHRSVWIVKGTLEMEYVHYRWGGAYAAKVFWPLEQIDRKLRPNRWYLW